MASTHRSDGGNRPRSSRRIRIAAATLALVTFAAFAASCSSSDDSASKSDSKSSSKSNSDSTSSSSTPAAQAAATTDGALAAVSNYVVSQNHLYAGDCADATLPKDKGKWCSTLIAGDDTTNTKTYAVGPVGGKAVSNVTVTRKGQAQLTPGVQVGVADGNVGTPQPLTAAEIAGNTFITGNLVLDQAAGIGNGLADLPAGTPAETPGDGTTPPTTPTTTLPTTPPVVVDPGGGTGEYPPNGVIVVVNPNITPGGEAVFRGSGCSANETLTVLFDGKVVGSLLSDSSGNFAGSLTVPTGTSPGSHLITVKGSACELNLNINVLGGLAFTGTSNHTSTVVLAGLAALIVGLVLVVGSRRRRTSGHSTGPPVT